MRSGKGTISGKIDYELVKKVGSGQLAVSAKDEISKKLEGAGGGWVESRLAKAGGS